MTTKEVADQLLGMCKEGKWDDAQKQLYADNAVSIEPEGGPWPVRTEGLSAIIAKGDQFNEMVEEMHGLEVSEPLVAGDHFCCTMGLDVTFKGAPRKNSTELCIYEVKDGKITSEQFFYPVPAPE